MIHTPRTDADVWLTRTEVDDPTTGWTVLYEAVVDAKFARELERELAAMQKQRDEARELYCVEAAQHSVCRRSVMDAWTIARYRGWEGLFKEGGGA